MAFCLIGKCDRPALGVHWMRIAPIGPERQGEPDKEHHSQNQKQYGLLDPRDRWNRQRQRKAEKADLKQQQVDTGEERTWRQ
jgi:hypothetical protein